MNEAQERFIKETILSLLADQEGKEITVVKVEKNEETSNDKTA